MKRSALVLAVVSHLACVAVLAPGVHADSEPAPPAVDAVRININTATPAELERLPGIGPARAQAIVEVREKRAFRRVEDIMRVPGIGRKTFGRIRSAICVE